MTDEELVKNLLQAGVETLEGKLLRRSLVEEVLGRHYQWIVGFCLSEIADSEVALDTAQEIMMQIAKSIGNFRGDSKLSTWIYTISRRQIVKSRNKHKTLRNRFLLSKPELEAPSEDSGVEQLLLKEESKRSLLKKVRALPEKQRHCVELHYFEDLSIKDVAERLGCSESTVKTHLLRARKKLQDTLIDQSRCDDN